MKGILKKHYGKDYDIYSEVYHGFFGENEEKKKIANIIMIPYNISIKI